MGTKKKTKSKKLETCAPISKCILAAILLAGVSIIFDKHGFNLIQPKDDRLYETNNDDFLQLVSQTYDDHDLVEWEPAPVPISKADEPGDLGAAVVVPPEKLEEAKARFKEHEFNVVANEIMPINRTLPDIRYPECLTKEFSKKLPQASVIVVYHNEAWSTLIRTIWSIITQTPKALLKEIILVDDSSTKEFLGKQLEDYVKTLPVRVIMSKTNSRVGLIQARLLGAGTSSGKVLVFLDAHCECNQGWLEALLDPIVKNRTNVVVPVIDVISFTDMSIHNAVTHIQGSFDLSLSFMWEPIPEAILKSYENDRTGLSKAPAMAGGLFAIDKEYFYNVGSYDEKMLIWGGENIEMSLRIWMCGGQLLTAPCSRVGHIFRDKTPYSLPGGADHMVHHNTARLADVWLDDYKHIYYSVNPSAVKKRTSTAERRNLRKRLKCKSFEWYLQNVFPENIYNSKNYTIYEIKSLAKRNFCVDSMGNRVKAIAAFLCHRQGGNQIFIFTAKNEIKGEKFCVDATDTGVPVTMDRCHGQQGNQKWIYDDTTKQIKHSTGKNCMTLQEKSNELTIETCNESSFQQWQLNKITIHLDDAVSN